MHKPRDQNDCLYLVVGQANAIELIDYALHSQQALTSKFDESSNTYVVIKANCTAKNKYIIDYAYPKSFPKKWTAAHYAASLGKRGALEILFQHGFLPQTVDSQWNNAADVAVESSHDETAFWIYEKYLRRVQVCDGLLYDACAGFFRNSSWILEQALNSGKKIVWDQVAKDIRFETFPQDMNAVIRYSRNWKNINENSNTAAHLCSKLRKYKEMSILLENGWDVSTVRDASGDTAMDIAKLHVYNKGPDDDFPLWLNVYENLCSLHPKTGNNSKIKEYMIFQAKHLMVTGSIDDMAEHIKMASQARLGQIHPDYETVFSHLVEVRRARYKKEIAAFQVLKESLNLSLRSRQSNILRDALQTIHGRLEGSYGKQLQNQLNVSRAKIDKWDDDERNVHNLLQEALKLKQILHMDKILSMAPRLQCSSSEFKNCLHQCQNARDIWQNTITNVLIDSGLPSDFVSRYISRICDELDCLPQVRWSQIVNIGIDNSAVAKIVARNLQLRGGGDYIVDGKDELLTLLASSGLKHYFEILTMSGFLDLEDLLAEDDLRIFEDMMKPDELAKLSTALDEARANLKVKLGTKK
jgi:hypothetical protein